MTPPPPEPPEPPRSCWLRGCLILAVVIPTLLLGFLIYGVVFRLS